MAVLCGFENLFFPVRRSQGRFAKVLTYIKHSWKMMYTLRARRPKVVWVQLPQVPVLWVALIYRRLFSNDAIIIADCHNAMFRPPWSKVPLGVSMLSKCDIIIAHNVDVMRTAVELGVDKTRVMVVEDPPASFLNGAEHSIDLECKRPWFVFPASFAADEPIAELLMAASATPDVSVLITGNTRNCRDQNLIREAPANVRFLGFLERVRFESLLQNCDAVIAFTRLEGVQLSVCGEAVGAERPMLVSDTMTLRRQFPEGTVFVDSTDSNSIAEGIKRMTVEHLRLAAEMKDFHARLRDEWVQVKAKGIADRIASIEMLKK
tara:strand:+ start:30 stop:989 length:960 start_codon:yes stop_codon:yes gene_type:complete